MTCAISITSQFFWTNQSFVRTNSWVNSQNQDKPTIDIHTHGHIQTGKHFNELLKRREPFISPAAQSDYQTTTSSSWVIDCTAYSGNTLALKFRRLTLNPCISYINEINIIYYEDGGRFVLVSWSYFCPAWELFREV